MTLRSRSLGMVAVLLLGATVSVFAHLKFESASPAAGSTVAAPSNIQVFFTEPPDMKVSKLELSGASGPVKLTGLHSMDKSLMAMVSDKMPSGVYTVAWQTAGNDGHVQKGDYKFTVK